MIDPGLIAIFASGIFAILIAYVWYHPKVFGTTWATMAGLTPDMQLRGGQIMPRKAIVGFIAAMLIAYVMTYVSAAWGFYTWQGALQLGIWCWAGFVAPILLSAVLWEQRPFKFYLINVLYWLVTLMVMAQLIVFAYGLQSILYVPLADDVASYGFE